MRNTIIFGLAIVLLAGFASAATFTEVVANSAFPVIQGDYPEDVQINNAEFVSPTRGTHSVVIQPEPPAMNDTFTFEPSNYLLNGDYTLYVNSSDRLGNSRMDSFNFSVDVPFAIYLVDPSFGVSPTATYDVVLNTTEDSHCAWTQLSNPQSMPTLNFFFDGEDQNTYTLTHTLADRTWDNRGISFICENNQGETSTIRVDFEVDAEPPQITVNSTPNPVIDPSARKSELTITTDEATVCTIDGELMDGEDLRDESTYRKTHTKTLWYNSTYDTDRHDFDYDIACDNKAGLSSSEQHTVTVELTSAFTIEQVLPETGFITTTSTQLAVRTPIQTECTYQNNGTVTSMQSSNSRYHTASVSGLSSGSHSYPVECLSTGDRESIVIQFNVDATAPTNATITATDNACNLEFLQASFSAQDNTGISYYNYSITGPSGTLVNWTKTSSATVKKEADLSPDGQYTWSMVAHDKGGLSAAAQDVTVTARNRSYTQCDDVSPSITINTTDDPLAGGKDVVVTCSDFHSGCTSSYNYTIVGADDACVAPDETSSYGNSQFIAYGKMICVWGYDNNDNVKFEKRKILGGVTDNCGNGRIDPGEVCDGGDLGSQSCSDFGFNSGSLKCTDACEFDTNSCTDGGGPEEASCGDGLISSGEQCEGSAPLACSDLKGFSSGTMECSSCMLDVSACQAKGNIYYDGDDDPEPGDDDDPGKGGNETLPTKEQPGPNCGNGQIDAGEDCDGNNLGGVSYCDEIGKEGGRLSCTSSCTYDESNCRASEEEFSPESEGTSIFAVIFLVLGLLSMMGGGGYLGYKKYYGPGTGPVVQEKKPKDTSSSPKKMPSKPQPKKPTADEVREAEKRKLLEEERRKKRKKEREELFDEFDE